MHRGKEKLPTMTMLTARSDFLIVQSKGKRWHSQSLVLQIYKNNLDIIRVGYTVSKKVDKSAVVRNRIKRRLRSIVNDVIPDAKNGYDYVLVGRKVTAMRSYDVLVNDFKWCLKKMELYQKGK